jgi:hypothetical protein
MGRILQRETDLALFAISRASRSMCSTLSAIALFWPTPQAVRDDPDLLF